jgi:predicted nucleic acid-binding Zn finger protein
VLLYSSVNGDIAHIAVQLQHNERLCCCIDCINNTAVDGWKKCTEVMAVATELYRNGAIVALSGVEYSDISGF